MCYSSHFKDTLTLENQPFVKRMEKQVASTNKKQVPLKSYSLEIRIDCQSNLEEQRKSQINP